MFNFQGQEFFIILVLALIVLGPERLPEAMRKFGNFIGEIRKMAGGFQQEFNAVVDEPMRQMRESVNMIRQQTDVRTWQDDTPASGESSAPSSEPAAPDPTTPFQSSSALSGSAQSGSTQSGASLAAGPTTDVPTFDTPRANDEPPVGPTEAFRPVESRGTDLREAAIDRGETDDHTSPNSPDAGA